MAYREFHRETSEIYSSSISWLDGVPFKIGPSYKPPNKVILPHDLLTTRSSSTALNTEYAFEIEQGVLLWADEREKQLEAQKRAEEERKIANQIREQEVGQSSDDSEPEDEWLASGSQNNTQPNQVRLPPAAVKTTATVVPLQPVIAGITSDILKPTPISPELNSNQTPTENKNVDVTLFEKEDDPFDMFERQTLNDFEELKSVFSTTADTDRDVNANNSGDDSDPPAYENVMVKSSTKVVYNHSANGLVSRSPRPEEDLNEDGEYVQLQEQNGADNHSGESTHSQIDVSKLPPISQSRTFLAGKIPLPPITGDVNNTTRNKMDQQNTDSTVKSTITNSSVLTDAQSVTDQNHVGHASSGPIYSNVNAKQPIYENADVLIQQNQAIRNVNRYSRNDLNSPGLNSVDSSPAHQPKAPFNYMNVLGPGCDGQTGLRNALSSPDITSNRSDLNIREDSSRRISPLLASRSPPPRPSSQQDLAEHLASWNKYSPLPNPGASSEMTLSFSSSSSSSDFASPSEIDPYLRLNTDGQHAVNSLAAMGFSRPQAARAVERFGEDEKEVIDYLCAVNKLAEEGFDTYQAETTLLLYNNNVDKAQQYLSLFQQFAELGFGREKIKEALVSNELDRDKALDYLTA